MVTGGNKRLQAVTRGCKGLRGVRGFLRGNMRLHRVRRGYSGLQ